MTNNSYSKFKPNTKNLMMLVDTNNIYEMKTYINDISLGINDKKISDSFLYSCKVGRIDMAKLLIDCVNPNSRNGDGQTVLMLFAQIQGDDKEKIDFLEFLIERGCDVDLVDCCGKSALHWAIIQNCVWSIRILIGKCNVNSVDLIGFTPLMYAAKSNLTSVISILLHAGADPTKCTKQHGSALHLAIRHGATAALQQMIPFCRHLNIVDVRCQTPIDLAILINRFDAVNVLLESKKEIELNRRPSYAPFRTPLEEACFKNNYNIVKMLLSAGAEVNFSLEFDFETDKNCRSKPVSPFMLAILKQNVDLVELLLKNGADVSVKCPSGPGYASLTTPLGLAIKLGNKNIINLVENRDKSLQFSTIDETFCDDIILKTLGENNISCTFCSTNGLPIFMELVKFYYENYEMVKIFNFGSKLLNMIFSTHVVDVLSRKSFGSAMQVYREAWLKAAAIFHKDSMEIQSFSEESYLQFIISFLESFFLKKRIDEPTLMQEKLHDIMIFPRRLVRLAVHSSRLIKSILLSRSLYSLSFFTLLHVDENLLFWDKKSERILEFCEFALFFDNIDASLIMNLTCGISLNFMIEYDGYPYTPEIINPSLDYNDGDKIAALKYLSRNVKPLKTLCKYTIRKFVNNDVALSNLEGLSQSRLNDLYLDLNQYINYFETSQNCLVRYHQLGFWAGIDLQAFNFTDF